MKPIIRQIPAALNSVRTKSLELIKGEKIETTPLPKRFKASKKKGDDAAFFIDKKAYGCTIAERDLIEASADQYGSYIGAWNAYEEGRIILYGNEAPILKVLATYQAKQHKDNNKETKYITD